MLLASCWCVTAALAASSTDLGCDNSTRRLQSLRVSVESLSVNSVEHISSGTEPVSLPAETAEVVSKAAAPILYLAPHIAAMFNYVFDGAEFSDASVMEAEVSEVPTAGRAIRTSDGEDGVTAPMNAAIPNNEIARFQRQMYRKDI
jgi:hypothetical protein